MQAPSFKAQNYASSNEQMELRQTKKLQAATSRPALTLIPSAARNLSSTPKGRFSIVAHEPPIVRFLAPLGMTRNEL
jgi:hypothetical protein